MKMILILSMIGCKCFCSEIMSDGQPVADQASERIPSATVTGITASPDKFPPGIGDLIEWVIGKIQPQWKMRYATARAKTAVLQWLQSHFHFPKDERWKASLSRRLLDAKNWMREETRRWER